MSLVKVNYDEEPFLSISSPQKDRSKIEMRFFLENGDSIKIGNEKIHHTRHMMNSMMLHSG